MTTRRLPATHPAASRSTSVNAVRACVMAATHAGLDISEAVTLTDVSPDALADPDARVPLALAYRAWDATAERLGDPHFGLHAAEAIHAMFFDAYDFAVTSASTLRDGVESMRRHLRLQHEGAALDLAVARGEARVAVRFHPADRVPPHFSECCVAVWLLRARALVARPFRPRQVTFRHGPPADVAEHRRVLATTPVFAAAEDGVRFDASFLDEPLRSANPPLRRLMDGHLVARDGGAAGEETLEARARAEVVRSLRGATPTVGRVASRMGVSVRSLQRALGDAGTSFNDLLDEARRDLAVARVSDPSRPLKLIAGELGFGQAAAFTRAFRRWTGRSPSAYRAEFLRRAGDAPGRSG